MDMTPDIRLVIPEGDDAIAATRTIFREYADAMAEGLAKHYSEKRKPRPADGP